MHSFSAYHYAGELIRRAGRLTSSWRLPVGDAFAPNRRKVISNHHPDCTVSIAPHWYAIYVARHGYETNGVRERLGVTNLSLFNYWRVSFLTKIRLCAWYTCFGSWHADIIITTQGHTSLTISTIILDSMEIIGCFYLSSSGVIGDCYKISQSRCSFKNACDVANSDWLTT